MSWVLKLPREKITQKALDALPEYSLSNPSGVFPGKVWKRNVGKGLPPVWVICEYVSIPGNTTHCSTDFRRPEVVE